MSLDLKNVRVPTPRVRAELVLACLEAHGPLNEYFAAGAISEEDGVAILRSKEAGMAMTLANAALAGETIHLKCLSLGLPGTDTVVVTPVALTGGTTITFNAKDDSAVLIWTGAAWEVRAGNTAVVA
jgi:hypothetical protein